MLLTAALRCDAPQGGLPGAGSIDTTVTGAFLSIRFGVDKRPGQLHEAQQAIAEKLNGGLPAAFYGRIDFMPLYIVSGNLLQYGVVKQGGEVGALHRDSMQNSRLLNASSFCCTDF